MLRAKEEGKPRVVLKARVWLLNDMAITLCMLTVDNSRGQHVNCIYLVPMNYRPHYVKRITPHITC